jgi:hypothetical protein
MLRRDVLEEYIASIFRVTRIGELGTTLAVTGKQSTLRRAYLITAAFSPQANYTD